MSENSGKFKKGNQIGIGHRGNNRPTMLTQELISQLNEVDKNTGKEKKHLLVEELIKHALGYTVTTGRGDKKVVTKVPSELAAIREVYDRLEGKPPQAVQHTGADGGPIEYLDAKQRLAHYIVQSTAERSSAAGSSQTH